MTDLSDEHLLNQLRSADTKHTAFTLLVKKYKESIYWYIRRIVIDHHDALDVTQDAFLKVWKNIDGFRGDASLKTWLYRIATNESLNFLRKKNKKLFIPFDSVSKELMEKFESSAYVSGDEISKKLEKAVLTLPNKQRIVFILRYFEEKSYEEIAKITITSIGSLQASYHLAVKKIEFFLNND